MKRILSWILIFLVFCIPASADSGPKYIALTFDDGPSGRFTEALLEGLAEQNVSATFFLCGYRLEDYGPLAEQIANAGHEIGLHGYSHDSMAEMTAEEIRRELQDTQALLPENLPICLMRPPGGACTADVEQVCKEMGLSVILWSVDPRDWDTDSVADVKSAILEQVHDGAVILMHDMYDSSVTAALELIEPLREQGYEFVTVSRLAQLQNRCLEPGAAYSGFSG